ncbi:MAG: lysylphosphatidylglycerol synthase transmembrane domain-containing protein [Myxococcota bacterium]
MSETPSKRRRALVLALQLAGSAAAFGYLFHIVDLDDILDAAGDLPAQAMLAAVALTAINLVIGALRWRVLLRAYGAPTMPPLSTLVRLYYVGLFYNTYLPGGVGGDVVRGVVTRRAFGEAGATSAVTVVLVERVLGLSALLTIVALVIVVAPPPGLDYLVGYALLGVAAGVGVVIAVAAARRFASWAPRRLQPFLESLPRIRSAGHFLLAVGYSFATQSMMALTGYVLLVALEPSFRLVDAFAIVPLASATAFLPITVGGAGAREAVFIALCTAATTMDETRAATAGLTMWAAQLVVAAVGGLLQLLPDRDET